jgi:nucleoid DNA-binding protein
MNKKDLIEIVAKKAHLTKKAAGEAIDSLLDEIKKSVKKGEKVVVSGFGTFKLVKVKDKKGRQSPKDPTPIVHKAHKVIRFVVAKRFRQEAK